MKTYFTTFALHHDDNTAYIVLDPDFIFRKPIPDSYFDQLRPGFFVSQKYSLMDPASYAFAACVEGISERHNNETYAKEACSLIPDMPSFSNTFAAGVPYILIRKDWLKLLDYWIAMLGPVLLRYPGIESDMISWGLAAAAIGMKSKLYTNFMATCMSHENASEEELNRQIFLHLCQSYAVPETRLGEQYLVNPLKELPYIVTPDKAEYQNSTYVFVFNKHWLKSSKLLKTCTVPLLIGPPNFVAPGPPSRRLVWHHTVATEAVNKINRAVVQYRYKYFPESKDCVLVENSLGLILHENHKNRFGGGWNHAILV